MQLKLCVHIHDISLYKNLFFIADAQALWLLWQLKISIDLLELAFISVLLQIF